MTKGNVVEVIYVRRAREYENDDYDYDYNYNYGKPNRGWVSCMQ